MPGVLFLIGNTDCGKATGLVALANVPNAALLAVVVTASRAPAGCINTKAPCCLARGLCVDAVALVGNWVAAGA